MGHSSLNPGKLGTPGRGLTAKAPRERVGTQYKGTQRTRKAVHGECTVELAKWTFLVISLSREPYEAKVSRTGLTGGMGRRTVRQRALSLPSKAVHTRVKRRERTPQGEGPELLETSDAKVIDCMSGRSVPVNVDEMQKKLRPTVSLGVTYVMVYTYGRDDGRIAPTRCALIDAGLDGR